MNSRYVLPNNITHLSVWGQIGSGKCLEENTKIKIIDFDNKKINKKIKDLPEKFKVFSYNFEKNKIEIKDAIKEYSGELDCYEIEFEDGSKVIASSDHKFYNKTGDIIITKELQNGDFLFDLYKYCKICSKKLINRQKKCCSQEHYIQYTKENKIGCFFNDELRLKSCSMGGKVVSKYLKDNKLGIFAISKDERIKIGHKGGKKGGLMNVLNNRKNKTGIFSNESRKKLHENLKRDNKAFYNKENCSRGGKIGGPISAVINRMNNTSAFFDKKIQSYGGIRNTFINRETKKGYFSDESHKKSQNTLKKLQKSAFYDPFLKKDISSKGGSIAIELIRKKSKYEWKGVKFLSKQEREVAKLILNNPIENVNCHIKVGNKIIDFFPINSDKHFINCFVEYHPCNNFIHKETFEEYYNKRRAILDDQGINNKLIVIQNIKEIKNED